MADYRQIHTSIWDDDWFCHLSNDEKVVFVWLFSNRRASVSGIYKFSEFICSRETGIPVAKVKSAIQNLVQDKKVYIEGEWVWVKNLRKYNDSKSPNSYKRIQSDLSLLPDNGLKSAYLSYYKDIESPYQAPTKPLEGGTDHLLEQEQEQEQEKEKEKEEEKSTPDDLFSSTQHMIESVIGIPPNGPAGEKAITDITAMNPTIEDIRAGVDWLRSQGKPVQYYSSLVGPIRTAISIRIQHTDRWVEVR